MAGGFSPERMTMVSQGYSTSPQIACSSNIVHMPIASASHTSSTSVVSRDCNGTPSSGSSGDDGSFADVPNPSQASNCFYAHYQDQHYDVAVKDSSTDTDFAISQAAVSDVMKGVIYSGDVINTLLQSVRSQTMPCPLPVPVFSHPVQAARASGNVLSERSTIIRETVKFFLNFKYWWTSEDYDRIAELVISEFPELRDPAVFPATPGFTKVRLDLSMCARNIRRLAKNQKQRCCQSVPKLCYSETSDIYQTAKRVRTGIKRSRKSSKIPMTIEVNGPARDAGVETVIGEMLPHTADHITGVMSTDCESATVSAFSAAGMPSSTTASSFSSMVTSPCGPVMIGPTDVPSTCALSTKTNSEFLTESHEATFPCSSIVSCSVPPGSDRLGMAQLGQINDPMLNFIKTALSNSSSATVLPPVAHFLGSHSSGKPVFPALPNSTPGLASFDAVDSLGSLKNEHHHDGSIPCTFAISKGSSMACSSASPMRSVQAQLFDYQNCSPSPKKRRILPELTQSIKFSSHVMDGGVHSNKSAVCELPEVDPTIPSGISDDGGDRDENTANFCKKLLAAACIIESQQQTGLHMISTSDRLVSSGLLAANPGVITHTQNVAGVDQVSSTVILKRELVEHEASNFGSPQPTDDCILTRNGSTVESKDGGVGMDSSQMADVKHEEVDVPTEDSVQDAWIFDKVGQVFHMKQFTGCLPRSLPSVQSLQVCSQTQALCSPSLPDSLPALLHTDYHRLRNNKAIMSTNPGKSLRVMSGCVSAPPSSAHGDERGVTAAVVSSADAGTVPFSVLCRSSCLPTPLPVPSYSTKTSQTSVGDDVSIRSQIIRETAKFFLSMKMWWSSQDYERITDLVVQNFPFLSDKHSIRKDLGSCARNMRRHILNKMKSECSKSDAMVDKNIASYFVSVNSDIDCVDSLLLDKSKEESSHRTACQYDFSCFAPIQCPAIVSRQCLQGSSSQDSHLNDVRLLRDAGDDKSDHLSWISGKGLLNAGISTDKQAPHCPVTCESILSSNSTFVTRPMYQQLPAGNACSGSSLNNASVTARQKETAESADALPAGWPHSHDLCASLPLDAGEHGLHTPLPAHSQSSNCNLLSLPRSPEEEVPMNLTCSTQLAKLQHNHRLLKTEISSVGWSAASADSGVEQLQAAHGPPCKKGTVNKLSLLPSPLPIPAYPNKLLKAREEGSAYCHRSEIIRETARFFLMFKYWWSSADYTRISELVVQQFPDLKDPDTLPGTPCFRRVQRDLSMCARNLRRKNARRQQILITEKACSPEVALSNNDVYSNATLAKSSGKVREQRTMAAAQVEGKNSSKREVIADDCYTVPEHCLLPTTLSDVPVLYDRSFVDSSLSPNPYSLGFCRPTLHPMDPSARKPLYVAVKDVECSCDEAPLFTASQSSSSSEIFSDAKCHLADHPATDTGREMPSWNRLEDSQDKQSQFEITGKNQSNGPMVGCITECDDQEAATESYFADSNLLAKVYIDPHHPSTLQLRLAELWQDGQFFDASLEVDDHRLPVHKLILLTASPYLRSTFRHANPTSHLEVNLPRNTGVAAARDFLKYLYQGVLHVSPTTVHPLRRISSMLQIEDLQSYCDDYIDCLSKTSPAACDPHMITSYQIAPALIHDPLHSKSIPTEQYVTAIDACNDVPTAANGDHVCGFPYVLHGRQPDVSRDVQSRESVALDVSASSQGGEGVVDAPYVEDDVVDTGPMECRKAAVSTCLSGLDQKGDDHMCRMMFMEPRSGLTDITTSSSHMSVIQCLPKHPSAGIDYVTRETYPWPMHASNPTPAGDIRAHTGTSTTPRCCSQEHCEGTVLGHVTDVGSQPTTADGGIAGGGSVEREGKDGMCGVFCRAPSADNVNACESTECVLLPQTYRSNCPQSCHHHQLAQNSLQMMAARWASEQYRKAGLDEVMVQEFANVLHDRLYHGNTNLTRISSPEGVTGNLMTVVPDVSTEADPGYRSITAGQLLPLHLFPSGPVLGRSVAVSSATDVGSNILPQTYCSEAS